MIQLLAKPLQAPRVNGEGLYSILIKVGKDDYRSLLNVRAKTGAQAEEKLAFCFDHELQGKTLSFDIETIKRKEQNET
jgi:hypothetical protein